MTNDIDGSPGAAYQTSTRLGISHWAGAILLSILFGFVFQDFITRFPRGLMSDDSYFYVKIAHNIASLGWSTFDGIHPTDGYHLLWAWILTAVSWLTGLFTADSSIHLGAMLSLYFFLCFAIAFLFGKNYLQFFLLFFCGVFLKVMMETTLLTLILLALMQNRFLREEEDAWRWLAVPLLIAVPMVRIDAILIVGVLSLVHLLGRPGWRAFFWTNGWASLGVLIQFSSMWLLSGHWLSVSAQIKAGSSAGLLETIGQNLSQNVIGLYWSNLLSLVLCLSFYLVAAANIGRPRSIDQWKRQIVLVAPLLGLFFHLAANSQVAYWYYIPSVTVSVWMAVACSPSRNWLRTAAYALFVLAIGAFLAKSSIDTYVRGPQITWSRTFVDRLREAVPPGEPVFQVDASGYIGWMSGLPIVNGDGLVNSHDYARRKVSGQLGGYLQEEGIRYIVSNLYPVNGRLLDMSGLRVGMDEVEAVIDQPQGYPNMTAFGLYRLKSDTAAQ